MAHLTDSFMQRSPFDITHSNLTLFPKPYIQDFFNQRWVQQELGVPLNFTTGFNKITQVWLGEVGDVMVGSLEALEKVIERGVNVALMYGDRDYRCPCEYRLANPSLFGLLLIHIRVRR